MIHSVLTSVVFLVLSLAAPASFAQAIHGTVTVASELAKKVTPSAVLFVIARPEGVQGGPPLAVIRVGSPKFPQAFEIGPKNVMSGGDFKGSLVLTAKLSKSGDPMTAPGDLLGAAEKPVSPGAKDVQLVLKKEAP